MSLKRHRLPPLLEAALQLEAEKGLSRLFLPSISVNQTQEHSMNPTNADLATDITTNCAHVVSAASTTTPLVEGVDRSQISDGYHTFAELYDHRHSLTLALMRALPSACWFSQRHSDGDLPFGSADWFIVGAELPTGAITYHLPIELLSLARQTGAVELSAGRPWDGHTAHDVIERLRAWAASSQPTLARFAHQPVPPAEEAGQVDPIRAALERLVVLARAELDAGRIPGQPAWERAMADALYALAAAPPAEGGVVGPSDEDLLRLMPERWTAPVHAAAAIQAGALSYARVVWAAAAAAHQIQSAPPAEGETGDLITLLAVGSDCRGGVKLSPEQCRRAALPPNYIDPEYQGEDLELLQTFYAACRAEGATADEIHLRGLRAVLATRPVKPLPKECH